MSFFQATTPSVSDVPESFLSSQSLVRVTSPSSQSRVRII